MSLSFDKINDDSKPIAIYNNGKEEKFVFLTPDDYEFGRGVNKSDAGAKKIKLSDKSHGSFFPVINPVKNGENDRIYISGRSGIGKSYKFIRPYILEFKKRYPKSKVFFFSSKMKDMAVDDLPIIRLNVDDNFIENPPRLDDFKSNISNSANLLVFDDVQDYPSAKHIKALYRFRNEAIRNGRSYKIYTLFLYHKPTAGHDTAEQIFESTAAVIFPNKSGFNDYDRLLETYLGIRDSKTKELLKRSKSDYVYISKSTPAFVVSDKYILAL